MLFVKGTRHHALVLDVSLPAIRRSLDDVTFLLGGSTDTVVALVTPFRAVASALRADLDPRGVPALARGEGEGLSVAEIDRGPLDRSALERHGRSGRIEVQAAPVEISAPALDRVPAHESPRNPAGEEARGDAVSFARQYPAILLHCRSGGLRTVARG